MSSKLVASVDVVRTAGVGQSAVPRYYTPSGTVSAKMAEKIRVAAEELGYRANVLAGHDPQKEPHHRPGGLLLREPVLSGRLRRRSVGLQENGYYVMLSAVSPTVGNVETVLQAILDYRVDGIIIASVSPSSTSAARWASRDAVQLRSARRATSRRHQRQPERRPRGCCCAGNQSA